MLLQRITQNFYKISDCIPKPPLSSFHEISQKIKTISLPAIALISSTLIQEARADTFTECIEACERNGRDAHELAKLLCYTFCWLFAK